MNLHSTIQIYAGGPGSGCNPAAGTCGRKPRAGSKEEFKQNYLQQHPEHTDWLNQNPAQLDRLYKQNKYGNLNVLHNLAKESGNHWQEGQEYPTGMGSAKIYTKDLGRNGLVDLTVTKTQEGEGYNRRMEVTVTVDHRTKSGGKYQHPSRVTKESFAGDTADSQAQKYLKSRWGLDYQPLKGFH